MCIYIYIYIYNKYVYTHTHSIIYDIAAEVALSRFGLALLVQPYLSDVNIIVIAGDIVITIIHMLHMEASGNPA